MSFQVLSYVLGTFFTFQVRFLHLRNVFYVSGTFFYVLIIYSLFRACLYLINAKPARPGESTIFVATLLIRFMTGLN